MRAFPVTTGTATGAAAGEGTRGATALGAGGRVTAAAWRSFFMIAAKLGAAGVAVAAEGEALVVAVVVVAEAVVAAVAVVVATAVAAGAGLLLAAAFVDATGGAAEGEVVIGTDCFAAVVARTIAAKLGPFASVTEAGETRTTASEGGAATAFLLLFSFPFASVDLPLLSGLAPFRASSPLFSAFAFAWFSAADLPLPSAFPFVALLSAFAAALLSLFSGVLSTTGTAAGFFTTTASGAAAAAEDDAAATIAAKDVGLAGCFAAWAAVAAAGAVVV